ncbi:MAG: pyruvate, phosphate dikinase, partial [Croceitalea sp.]|nr:pyruvate, phosphate dikinase [Croceitalea sp.]
LEELLPMQRSDFEGIFEAMEGMPVTVRLLDPPLHEFVPHQLATQKELAEDMHISLMAVKNKVAELHEFNPMLGHRGCRLGNTYPEITEMQTRAIIEAALNLKAKGIISKPEIMVPLVGTVNEFVEQEKVIRATAQKVFEEYKDSIEFHVGTMIEVPRAAIIADAIAEKADFFSFGTNDLTQMTFGYSRDDAGKFLPIYIQKGILKVDPFEVLDKEGVGQLIQMGTEKGRRVKPNFKIGICGEHGGEPSSVEFCHNIGMNYVSCSPFRVPISRVSAAQAVIKGNR